MRHVYLIPAGLLFFAWLSPLHVMPWLSWHNELLAILAVLVGGAGALHASRTRPPETAAIAVPTLVALPLALAAVAWTQWFSGRIVHAGSVWAITSYAFIAAAAAAGGHAAGRGPAPSKALATLAWTLVLAVLLQCWACFVQVFDVGRGSGLVGITDGGMRSGGNFSQPNQAALLFVLGAVATVYLASAKRLGLGVAALVLAMIAAGLATTQSRSGLLALSVLVVLLPLRRDLLGGRRAMLAALAYWLLAVLLFWAWPELFARYWSHAETAVNLTTSGRGAMWAQLWEAVQMRPWLGWGVLQVAEAQNAVADRFPRVMATTYAHNVLLDLALWVGLPAMAVTVGVAAAWAWRRLRAVRSLDQCFCVAIALPLATQSMTEFPFAYMFFIVPVFFVLGLLDAQVGRSAGWRLGRRPAIALLAGAVAMHAWAAVEYAAIEEDFRIARFEALRYGATPGDYERPDVRLLTHLGALLEVTRLEPRPDMSAQELARVEAMARLYPWGATNFRYITALALNGRMDEARRQLRVLRAVHGEKTYDGVLQSLGELALRYPVLRELLQP